MELDSPNFVLTAEKESKENSATQFCRFLYLDGDLIFTHILIFLG